MDMQPVFTPDGGRVLAKVERGGRLTYALDGRCWGRSSEALWDPVCSPDGSKVLVRGIEGGQVLREVVPLQTLARG